MSKAATQSEFSHAAEPLRVRFSAGSINATRPPIANACARPRQEHFDLHPVDPGEDPQTSD